MSSVLKEQDLLVCYGQSSRSLTSLRFEKPLRGMGTRSKPRGDPDQNCCAESGSLPRARSGNPVLAEPLNPLAARFPPRMRRILLLCLGGAPARWLSRSDMRHGLLLRSDGGAAHRLGRNSTRCRTGIHVSNVGLCARSLVSHRGRSYVRGMRGDRRTRRSGERSWRRPSRHAARGLVPCGRPRQRCAASGRRSGVRGDPPPRLSHSTRNSRRMYPSGRRSWSCPRRHASRHMTRGLVPCGGPHQRCAAPGRASMRGRSRRCGGAWRSGCPWRRGGPWSHRGVPVISRSTVRRSIV
jgi:hypothetical protein